MQNQIVCMKSTWAWIAWRVAVHLIPINNALSGTFRISRPAFAFNTTCCCFFFTFSEAKSWIGLWLNAIFTFWYYIGIWQFFHQWFGPRHAHQTGASTSPVLLQDVTQRRTRALKEKKNVANRWKTLSRWTRPWCACCSWDMHICLSVCLAVGHHIYLHVWHK